MLDITHQVLYYVVILHVHMSSLQQYKDKFAEHGYTRLDFIEGMTIEVN